jgi:SAM-dependent methyltransferase
VRELDNDLLELLRAPGDGSELIWDGTSLRARDGSASFPVVDGVPILLPADSAFSVAEYLDPRSRGSGIVQRLGPLARRALPSLSHNLSAARNLERFRALLHEQLGGAKARVLVVGGAILGEGMDRLVDDPEIDLVEIDVAVGPRTDVVCDAHMLPFAAGVFDGAICQAVLEHVADPPAVVAEVHRVLKPRGLAYSEIPFMQQVHEGAYDFTRFTYNGHRRLFRSFEEIDAGATAGPGMALGWSVRSLLTAFAGERARMRLLVNLLTTLALFWLKYLDLLLMKGPAILDGASGTFFLGRAREQPRSDREIIAGYRGVNRGFSARR